MILRRQSSAVHSPPWFLSFVHETKHIFLQIHLNRRLSAHASKPAEPPEKHCDGKEISAALSWRIMINSARSFCSLKCFACCVWVCCAVARSLTNHGSRRFRCANAVNHAKRHNPTSSLDDFPPFCFKNTRSSGWIIRPAPFHEDADSTPHLKPSTGSDSGCLRALNRARHDKIAFRAFLVYTTMHPLAGTGVGDHSQPANNAGKYLKLTRTAPPRCLTMPMTSPAPCTLFHFTSTRSVLVSRW